jgi:hypothetical protein
MKKLILVISFCIFALTNQPANAQTVEKTVEKIRLIYNEISEKAKAAEKDDEKGELGNLVMNELVINKRRHQWRAVGIYVLTYKFFYQSIDESANPPEVVEKHLYPDQLVKVAVEKNISNRAYLEEFIYDKTGALVFYFQKVENDDTETPKERRVYFSAGKPIRIIEDEKKRDKLTVADLKTVREISMENLQIKEMFARSLKL